MFNPYLLHGLGIASSRDNIQYSAITADGKTTTFTPVAIDERDVEYIHERDATKALRTLHKRNYWFQDTGSTMYFKYAACQNDASDPMTAFIQRMKNDITANKIKKVVIDLRENGGGSSTLLEPFMDYLAQSPLNISGGIYVLIGRGTFSSAVLNAAILKARTKAIFVGEETSGSVNHFGEVRSCVLPATGRQADYSTKKFNKIRNYDGPLIPDVRIIEKFSDFENYRDAVLDYALTH